MFQNIPSLHEIRACNLAILRGAFARMSILRHSFYPLTSGLWSVLIRRCKTSNLSCDQFPGHIYAFALLLIVLTKQAQNAGSVQQFDKALKLYNQVRTVSDT